MEQNELTYDDIRNIYRKEMYNPELSVLEVDFYKRAFALINKLAKKELDLNAQRELKNLKNLLWRIIQKRSQKIVFRVSKQLPHEASNLTSEEHKFYDEISQKYNDYLNELSEKLEKSLSLEEQQEQEVQEQEAEEELSPTTIPLKMLKDVEAYRSRGGVIFGPFKKDEIVYVPKKEAEFLVSSNFAEYA